MGQDRGVTTSGHPSSYCSGDCTAPASGESTAGGSVTGVSTVGGGVTGVSTAGGGVSGPSTAGCSSGVINSANTAGGESTAAGANGESTGRLGDSCEDTLQQTNVYINYGANEQLYTLRNKRKN